ncbi:MAG: hypothetical protein ABI488_06315 [Polyangiaceae bacterium]
MRAFSACLAVVLGLGTCYLAACSSDSDAGGNAGDAGESSSAGSSGKSGSSGAGGDTTGAAGDTTGAGGDTTGAAGDTTGAAGDTTGAAGAASTACAFESDACTGCFQKECATELAACAPAVDCGGAISDLDACACDSTKSAEQCETAFVTNGGTKAQPLVDCFNANCATACSN